MAIQLVDQLFMLVSWVLFVTGREKERLPGTYGLPLWRVTELGSFITMALSLPFTLSHPLPVTHKYHLGWALCDPGKGEQRKAEGVICGATGLGDMSVGEKGCFKYFRNGCQPFKIRRGNIKLWIYSSI